VMVLYWIISSWVMTWQRERRNDGVDARAVLQAGVDNGLRFVDAAAHLGHDLFDDMEQVRVVLKTDRGFGEFAVALDEHLVVAIDKNVRDRRLLEQGFKRPESENFVEHLFDNLGLLRGSHRHALFIEQAFDHAADFRAHAVLGDGGDAVQVEHADQLAMDLRLQLEVAIRAAGGHGRRPAAMGYRTIGSHGRLLGSNCSPGSTVQSS
jgi:hypothetical protein